MWICKSQQDAEGQGEGESGIRCRFCASLSWIQRAALDQWISNNKLMLYVLSPEKLSRTSFAVQDPKETILPNGFRAECRAWILFVFAPSAGFFKTLFLLFMLILLFLIAWTLAVLSIVSAKGFHEASTSKSTCSSSTSGSGFVWTKSRVKIFLVTIYVLLMCKTRDWAPREGSPFAERARVSPGELERSLRTQAALLRAPELLKKKYLPIYSLICTMASGLTGLPRIDRTPKCRSCSNSLGALVSTNPPFFNWRILLVMINICWRSHDLLRHFLRSGHRRGEAVGCHRERLLALREQRDSFELFWV